MCGDQEAGMPLSLAWDAFGTSNGAPTLREMRKRIAFYRNQADDPRQDYMIGCRILTQPFFFPEHQWIHRISARAKTPPPTMKFRGEWSLKRNSSLGCNALKFVRPPGCQKFTSSTLGCADKIETNHSH
jgi:hypothetical protein